ncbi:MAG: beta-lactamase family protein [Acidimicrobiales bacterium]|nr:beta-lactamase family protein [Acidimicrobiales bacterium]
MSTLAEVLTQINSWPVTNAATVAVDRSGLVAYQGDLHRIFPIASVSKLLSAYGCLIAIEEETLGLDEPAGPPGSTVRHLLAHTSGYSFDNGVINAPATKRIYSNTGFEVLANHLAESSGITAQSYLTEAVLAPLSMDSTGFDGRSLAHGARSSASDLARFVSELLNPTLVHAETLRDATSNQFGDLAGILPGLGHQNPNPWGLGFEIRGHKAPHWTGLTNSPATYGHFGASGTFVWIDPTLGLGLVVLTDEAFGPWAKHKWPELSDAVLGAYRP